MNDDECQANINECSCYACRQEKAAAEAREFDERVALTGV